MGDLREEGSWTFFNLFQSGCEMADELGPIEAYIYDIVGNLHMTHNAKKSYKRAYFANFECFRRDMKHHEIAKRHFWKFECSRLFCEILGEKLLRVDSFLSILAIFVGISQMMRIDQKIMKTAFFCKISALDVFTKFVKNAIVGGFTFIAPSPLK